MALKPKSSLQLLASTGAQEGKTVLELLDQYRGDVVRAVRRSGKKGSITITLNVEPTKFNKGRALAITGQVKASIPQAPGEPSHFFDDEDGGLYDDDVQRFNGENGTQAESMFPRAVENGRP